VEITTEGLIIAKHKFKESSNIITLFTSNKGILKGVFRGGASKKNLYLLQLGNLVNITWQARLEDHLGTLKLELKSSSMPSIINNMRKLLALKTVCELIYALIPEKDNMPELYNNTAAFLNTLMLDDFFSYYIKWELSLLKHLGYGLDFSMCAVCGKEHELTYISPKTGAAVCEKVGEPYKNKLLVIPKFFNHSNSNITITEKREALILTGHFIEHVCENYHKSVPHSRSILVQNIL